MKRKDVWSYIPIFLNKVSIYYVRKVFYLLLRVHYIQKDLNLSHYEVF